MPRRSTAVMEGTMEATHTPRASGKALAMAKNARRGPLLQAWAASCSIWPASGTIRRWGMRALASTRPSASAATALTEVVPMSMPMVTSAKLPPRPGPDVTLPSRPVIMAAGPPRRRPRPEGGEDMAARGRHRALVTAPLRGPGLDKLRGLAEVVLDPWIDQNPIRIYRAEELAE